MKKHTTIILFSLLFFSLSFSPLLASDEMIQLTQQKERAENLLEKIENLITLAENRDRDDVVLVLKNLLPSVENILERIEKKKEEVVGSNRFCNETDDCCLIYCLNASYIEETLKRAEEAGIAIDFMPIPPNSSCLCQNNRCTTVVDSDKRDQIREGMVVNNEGVSGFRNLIDYRSDIKTDYTEEYSSEIGRFDIVSNDNIVKDESILAFNVNLPGGLNLIVEKEEFLRCEDDDSIANHLCQNNQYSWRGRVRGGDSSLSQIYIAGNDGGILLSIRPIHMMSVDNDNNQYTYTLTNKYLIVQEDVSF